MKVIQSNPRDGLALLQTLKLKTHELKERHSNSSPVVDELHRCFHYHVVGWLKEQGFDVVE